MEALAIICDLDGTVFSNEWRSELHVCGKDNEHYYGIPFDPPIPIVLDLLKVAYQCGIHIHYMTGRYERYRMHTMASFEKHDFPPGSLWMRPYNVHLNNSKLKEYLYHTYVKVFENDILFAIDDNPKVCEMWKKFKIPAINVRDPKLQPTLLFGLESLKNQ